MKITIDNKEITVIEGETILEAARRNGIEIPSMCYAEGKRHQAGCMVCTVKELKSGRMLTSCSTKPTEGMEIDTSSEEVIRQRTMALELLLSDHRADCEAPCTMVCTHTLDVTENFLRKLFLGQDFFAVGENLEEILSCRYGGSSRKAVVVSYRDALKRYRDLTGQ